MENEIHNEEFDEWLSWIQQVKVIYEKQPIPAQLDSNRIITPGYNGIHLDIDASKRQMGDARNLSKLVFKEIESTVSISDLPPAPIYFGNPNKPMVSFMVNVAWGNEFLLEVLRVMADFKVKSTFFLDGSWVHKFPLLAEKIMVEGHEIGNHAYSHPDMRGLTEEQIAWELETTNQVIQKELGVKPTLFTPPSGEFDQRVVNLAAREGMVTILSTIDTLDWQDPPHFEIISKVKERVKNGSFILMHPTKSSLMALPLLIPHIQAEQYKIGTVGEVLSSKRVDLNGQTL